MAYGNNYNSSRNNAERGKSRTEGRSLQGSTSSEKRYEPLVEELYVERAEQIIRKLNKENPTTNQIRNILSMINQIYNDVVMTTEEHLSDTVQSQLRYLKVKIIYAAGRDKKVKRFIEESQLIGHLDHIGTSRNRFILFSHYMEALVAYHCFLNDQK